MTGIFYIPSLLVICGTSRHTGVFDSWEECQVSGFSGALHQNYKTKEEAFAAYSRGQNQEGREVDDKPVAALKTKKTTWTCAHSIFFFCKPWSLRSCFGS